MMAAKTAVAAQQFARNLRERQEHRRSVVRMFSNVSGMMSERRFGTDSSVKRRSGGWDQTSGKLCQFLVKRSNFHPTCTETIKKSLCPHKILLKPLFTPLLISLGHWFCVRAKFSACARCKDKSWIVFKSTDHHSRIYTSTILYLAKGNNGS